jgi:hypothetical protein
MLLKPQPFLRPKSRRLPKGTPVTVCIAALCLNGTLLIGASDRMLTAGDIIEYEPEQTKIIALTNSIVIMCAGDAALQTELIQQVSRDVDARIKSSPENWWAIRDVAFLYNRYYNLELKRRAESAVLAPLGLNSATFIQSQARMSASLVSKLASEILNFAMPDTETIFAGVDSTGAHIYVAAGPNLSCHDTSGFATIGGGSWHANSEFMFAGHHRAKPGPDTMFRVFSAKKRAEVAPGVGKVTDMWAMGPQLGSFASFPAPIIADIEKIYEARQTQIDKATKEAEEKTYAYVQKLSEGETQQIQESAADAAAESAPALTQGETPPRETKA